MSDGPPNFSSIVTIVELAQAGQPEPFTQITITALPDNVLLEIFDFYLDADRWVLPITDGKYPDLWHALVHVCRRWRCVVSASPRRLRLHLLCTEKRPVKRNIWPELPIIMWATIPTSGRSRSQGVNIIIAALRQQCNRVCQMYIKDIPNSLLKKFAAIKTPFPALTHLALQSSALALPYSFLEGSAPRLQSLRFQGIPFRALGNLLLSSCDLSELILNKIPHSSYISPDALVSSLSGLTRLRVLLLAFQSPRSRAARESRAPPSLTRVVLPALVRLRFKGDSEYLEDILSRTETPPFVNVMIKFFNQMVFDTPLLHNLMNRAQTFKPPHRAEITLSSDSVSFALGQTKFQVLLGLRISCKPSDWQLSSLAQVIGSSIPPHSTLEHLELREDLYRPQRWQDDIENAQWLEILRPFTSVKHLILCGELVRLVAPVLGELNGERVAEVLPALQNLFVEDFRLPEPIHWLKEIQQFRTARLISGRRVILRYPDC